MTREHYEAKECTVAEARRIIRKARGRKFLLCVRTSQTVIDDPDHFYPGYGHVEISRKTLLRKIFDLEEGKYSMFSQVVKGLATVKITDTGRLLFIG